MLDATLYDWHAAPVADAFNPSRYPPAAIVNPAHVGYSVQRYLKGEAMGERVNGYYSAEKASALCDTLNSGMGLQACYKIRRAYL